MSYAALLICDVPFSWEECSAMKYSVDLNKRRKFVLVHNSRRKTIKWVEAEKKAKTFLIFPFAISFCGFFLAKTFSSSFSICHFTADYVVEFKRERLSHTGEENRRIKLLCKGG
jgi:hypothetical protein